MPSTLFLPTIPNWVWVLFVLCLAACNHPAITPKTIWLVATKQSKTLDVWQKTTDSTFQQVRTFPLVGNYTQGPKLYPNDSLVPEGIYLIANTAKNTHDIPISYPNEFDLRKARADNRPTPSNCNILLTDNPTYRHNLILTPNHLTDLHKILQNAHATLYIVPYHIQSNSIPPAYPTCYPCPQWTAELYGHLYSTLQTLTDTLTTQ